MRAKLRVLVGKHFFSYRYDYREEWLRFTQTLSAQDSPQAMGEQVIVASPTWSKARLAVYGSRTPVIRNQNGRTLEHSGQRNHGINLTLRSAASFTVEAG